MMKNLIRYVLILSVALTVASCEDYLDKTIETDLTEEDVFSDFFHAQSFLEQCYRHIVAYAHVGNQNDCLTFLLGEETMTRNTGMLMTKFDDGKLNEWKLGYFRDTKDFWHTHVKDRTGIWGGWEGIRKANIVLANVDGMEGASQTEKDLLKGQALFFRAYFHHEIMKFWGAVPYIDKVLSGETTEDGKFDYQQGRPDMKELALKIDADYEAAAELLPYNWDDLENDPNAQFWTFREETFGTNLLRINKVIVYAMKGKNLIIAGSPLFKGSMDTYDYDEELCEMAAEAFARVIQMDREDINGLGLASAENHSRLFYTLDDGSDRQNWASMEAYVGPGQGEFIFSAPSLPYNFSSSTPNCLMPYRDYGNPVAPNHRYIHNTFGTANGLPCDEDPTHDFQNEFDNRDPRFYHNLIIDGDKIIERADAEPMYKYAQCYNDGYLATRPKVIRSGYYVKKWADITFNMNNQIPGQKGDNIRYISTVKNQIRLTDVYLLYSEALAATETYGVTGTPSYSFMPGGAPSALDALNLIRDRWSIPHVEFAYARLGIDITSDPNKFMDILRKDRAAELCYEGHRWMDIRRWVVAHLEEYRIKSLLNYDRDVVSDGDRSTFTNINFEEEIYKTRVCEYPKHYWLPFPTAVTQMFEGFPQNPGW